MVVVAIRAQRVERQKGGSVRKRRARGSRPRLVLSSGLSSCLVAVVVTATVITNEVESESVCGVYVCERKEYKSRLGRQQSL